MAAVKHDGCGVLRCGFEGALARFGKPLIFNTDQFTSTDFTGVLRGTDVKISMDGRGRWIDNVFIERLWQTLKYECVYLNAFETGSELRTGLSRWIGYLNEHRPHSRFGGRTPDEVYGQFGATPNLGHARIWRSPAWRRKTTGGIA